MKLRFLILFAFSILLTPAFAQIRSFSVYPETYITELEVLLKESGDENLMLTYEQFKLMWNGKIFSEIQTKRIIKLNNLMLIKRLKARPDFEEYILTLIALVKSNQLNTKFDIWFPITEKLLKDNPNDFMEFIRFSKGLFSNNAIFEIPTRHWISTNVDYVFSFNNELEVIFNNTNIICNTPGDTILITNTSGKYFPLKRKWEGTGGRVDWTRVGLDPSMVFCHLKNYVIDVNRSEYTADSVSFIHKEYLSKPLLGRVSDNAMHNHTGLLSTFPKFDSYDKNLTIDNFVKDARYIGGFSMAGAKIIGRGSTDQKATFLFYYKKVLTMKVQSLEFALRPENILTTKASLVVYLDKKDSIFHSELNFNYNTKDKKITMSRGNQGINSSPFFDSFHKLEMLFDEISWKLEEPKIDMRMTNPNQNAIFESGNYYRDNRYEQLQSILDMNPLVPIKIYCEKYKTRTFTLDDYALHLNAKKEFLIAQCMLLADKGYIYYDVDREQITVKDKLIDYVNANRGRVDFDVIHFESLISALPNASVNLENFDLKLQGVPNFVFSDSQSVFVMPREQVINVKKNRTLEFGGRVHAGRADFYGAGFSFDYTNFKVSLTNIDSLKFTFPSKDLSSKIPIKTVLRNIYGTLYIDHPYNKSGRRDYPEYPIFKSEKGANVFYDYPTNHNGVYTAERFYFEADPFTIDSLDNYTMEGLQFPGNFVSADIFPEFRDTLSVMPDYSLGFVTHTPPGGYPMYKGKGNGDLLMTLSNAGLYGNGEIKYLAATIKSEKFTLMPDTMEGIANTFDLAKTEIYPEANAKDAKVQWTPYRDSMAVTSQATPINMYGNIAQMTGTISVTPTTLNGTGTVGFEDAEINSKAINFANKDFKADPASFRIKSIDPTKFSFAASNVKAYINFETKTGDFKTNLKTASNDFLSNRYKSSHAEFKWLMQDKVLEFDGEKQSQPAYFISTDPEQDSLYFTSRKSFYDLRTDVITAEQVPFVDAADSRIFPDSNRLVIEPSSVVSQQYTDYKGVKSNINMQGGGVIRPLKNAKLYTDTLGKQHNIYNANISIYGRKKFAGSGYYDYIDKNKEKQVIFFEKIGVDTTYRTYAQGNIEDSVHFTLGPRIQFRGPVNLRSTQKFLEFDGFFVPIHTISSIKTLWVRFTGQVNPDSVFLPANSPRNADKLILSNGFSVAVDTVQTYTTFFTRKRKYSDFDMMRDSNMFYYDDKIGEFIVGDPQKLFNNSLRGNYMSVNDVKGIVYSEGRIDLGLDKNLFSIKSAGSMTHDVNDSVHYIDMAMLLDFPLPADAMKEMVALTIENGYTSPDTKNDRESLVKAMAELVDDTRDRKRMLEELQGSYTIRMVSELEKTLLLTDVKMKWNHNRRSFVSTEGIGVGAMGKTRIEKKLLGKIEIVRRRASEEITIYLQANESNWFYFNFSKGQMNVISSSEAFNEIIKTQGDKISKDGYKLRLATVRNKIVFLKE
jgi:hypothetical protein